MAATARQLLAKAKSTINPLLAVAEKEITTHYSKILERNAEYVVKDPVAAEKLGKQWFYTKISK
jgi:hypothetical protein